MNTGDIELGLKQNWKQFVLLIVVNAFVGGMIGLERSVFPHFAHQEFGISSKTALLSFITAFGFTKAAANYFSGKLSNRFGRKNLLILGWIFAIPVPLIFIYAESWNLIILANVLLGISQGFAWSSTVMMKIDLVGEKERGLAMGINEFAGYLAVGVVSFLTGYIASHYGITPYTFYLGIGISWTGLLITIIWIKDTSSFVRKESMGKKRSQIKNIFIDTSFTNKTLSAVTQAGLVNNLNDGMIWGLLPIYLFSLAFDHQRIGLITAIYPIVWGIGQLFTGKMSDVYNKKKMIFWGMLLQGVAILFIPLGKDFLSISFLSVLLGLGTALVYPTFLTTIALISDPIQRAERIGVFRLWRDSGYAIGAILSGVISDFFSVEIAIYSIGMLTVISSIVVKIRMPSNIK
jgi:MFS family permease